MTRLSSKLLATAAILLGLAYTTEVYAAAPATVGPHGESATPSSALSLTPVEIAKLKAGHYTAAFVWHTTSDFTNGVTAGATDTFAKLGIKVIATTDAGFDSAKQMDDVQTITARRPSVILSLPLDPVGSAAAFRPALADGTKLVFLSNVPNGYKAGKDYVAIVTDDLHAMGSRAADALASAIGDKGKVGYIFHDAQYYVTNQRDQAFKSTIEDQYKNITINEQQGISDPANAEDIANAMLTKTPGLDGIYVTWAEPAEGVLAALRAAGNKHTKIVTLDLSEPIALDMAQNGNVAAIVADATYELGRTMATAAAYGLLGKPCPGFIVAPAMTITKANLLAGYEASLHREAPKSVIDALK
ncbi:substrate-binding domain-containing protein [Acidisoma cellulosilytica]|uniref:Substrate-binding domain-containing protein n=1 Tax=Acidisoma cellulosilyticum TaxID=2802395 RepID=A0A963Z2R5_9PROT|nr:substrate-binding domain-containing protein [Acidisoma cellulosilyticum]MCB8881441.1 substrate-binding domain-containing protein [Acidisoma cellulosilyticum]